MSNCEGRDGVALPLTIYIITIVTIMLAAALVRVGNDRLVAESSGDMVDALAVAQSGLQTYLGATTARPSDGDSVRINALGGYADVVTHLVRRPTDSLATQTFIVRSTGHVITPKRGALPQASRTIAQFARWQTGHIAALGAFTAANGVRTTGPGGGFTTISGIDSCGVAPTAVGLRVPLGPINPPIPNTDIQGAPPILEADNGVYVAGLTGIDWEGTIGGGLLADYTTVQERDSTWSVQLIDGDLELADTWGTGLLIVSGDLTFEGASAAWSGVVLVGGELNFNASQNSVEGLLVTGLNYLLNVASPQKGDIRGSNIISVVYNSCVVRRALTPLTGFVPIRNAWIDNWATY